MCEYIRKNGMDDDVCAIDVGVQNGLGANMIYSI